MICDAWPLGTATLDIKGCFLYGTIATTNGGRTLSGKVTGGTGAFTDATGTITARAINKTGRRRGDRHLQHVGHDSPKGQGRSSQAAPPLPDQGQRSD